MPRSEDAARLLADWFDGRRRGDAPSPDELLRAHPELADQLRDGLAGFGVLELPGESTPSSALPDTLGDFRIVREIGRGGMGVVYEAEQVSMSRHVALKVLTPSLTGAQRAVKRFEREAKAAGRLHHTNIVPVFGMGQDAGYWYYAMELVQGRALSRIVQELGKDTRQRRSRHGLELFASTEHVAEDEAPPATAPNGSDQGSHVDAAWFRRIAEVFAGVADALHTAHDDGVIHRDVKPSNLLLDADGTLKIVDFGLAWLDAPGPSMTLTGDLIGTPAYMSPEQAMARRVGLDHRTDIYSLGATLYEVLTLRAPFDGETLQALCSQIITKDPVLPRKLDDHIPKDLETIVLKAMEKDRDKRYQRATDLAADLRRFASGHLIRARRVGPIERSWRKVKRHPRVAALVALLIVCGSIGIVVARDLHDERRQRLDLEYARVIAEIQNQGALVNESWHRSPSGEEFSVPSAARRATVEDVEQLLSRAIEIRPERPEAYWLRVLFRRRIESNPRADLAAAIERGLPRSTAQLFTAYLDVTDRESTSTVEIPPVTEEASPLDDYLRARIAMHGGDMDSARPLLDRAIELSQPGEITRFLATLCRVRVHVVVQDFAAARDDLHALRGLGYRGLQLQLEVADFTRDAGDTERARQLLEDLLARADPETVEGQVYRAEALHRLDRADEALAIADTLLADESTRDHHHQLRHVRAAVLSSQSQNDQALKELDRAIADDPCPMCYFARGAILMDQQHYQEALADYESYLDRDAGLAAAWLRKAVCLDQVSDWQDEEALRAYERAIALAPRWAKTRFFLGVSLMRRARLEDAERSFRAALEIEPDNPQLAASLAAARRMLGEYEPAIAVLESHAAMQSLDGRGWQSLVRHYYETGERGKASDAAREWTRQHPNDSQAWSALATMCIDPALDPSRQDLAEGLAAARRAVELLEVPGPHTPGPKRQLPVLARALFVNGKVDEAIDAALDTLADLSSNPTQRGEVEFVLSELEEYLRHSLENREFETVANGLERLLELADHIPEPLRHPATWLYHAGFCQLQLGEAAASYTAYARALELDPRLDSYNAACAAIRASMMATADLPPPAALRARALSWMGTQWQRAQEVARTGIRPAGSLSPEFWLHDPDFEPVRDPDAMGLLADAERAEWQAFWDEVAAWMREQQDESPGTGPDAR